MYVTMITSQNVCETKIFYRRTWKLRKQTKTKQTTKANSQQKLNKQKNKTKCKEKNVQRIKPSIDALYMNNSGSTKSTAGTKYVGTRTPDSPPGFTAQLERQATQISDFWNVKVAGTETEKTPEFKV